ncbi:MAG: tRNA pseudouridine(38-40) synthase TruA [Saprospiraceae bacterium]|nr:tRNA pseudouridine(38-40) synthase TruA [Saprospiraceae bacterium]
MRYFLQLSYNGAAYSGWQSQPNGTGIQAVIQDQLHTLFRQPVEIVGCGRTDAGVHATGFFAHFDWPEAFPEHFHVRLNKLLPPDIAVQGIHPVHVDAHARFDARQRRYRYQLHLDKDPLTGGQSWFYPYGHQPDIHKLNEAAQLLLNYGEFAPFCKSGTDAMTRKCQVSESFWVVDRSGNKLTYWITSDRFLRGMIRLIVGMCLRVSEGKLDVKDVKKALDDQSLLEGSWSVPADGLTLHEVKYPYLP